MIPSPRADARWPFEQSIVIDASSLVARPVGKYADLWGTTPDNAARWARDGKIPGAFKGPDGDWWVKPLDLIEWSPPHETARKRVGDGRPHPGELVREVRPAWQERLRPGLADQGRG